MILDTFAGCATTCVAAEKLERQWVGIDIWDEAHQTVIDCLKKMQLIGPEGDTSENWLFTAGDITYSTGLPACTDDKQEIVPLLRPKYKEPNGKRMMREDNARPPIRSAWVSVLGL